MKKQPKVSIVVPIYGVEKYLNQCIDSILAQTLTDIEIILVDDGSPDKCPQIVDEYAKKDKRVVAVHQSNGGYGVAVNQGIELARGEYIGIIESDDWIEPTMYEKLYNNAVKNNSDVVKCGFYVYDSTKEQKYQNHKYCFRPRQCIEKWPDKVFTIKDFPLCISMHASIWAGLYKSDFIKKIKLVESKSSSYQDFPFLIQTMCTAKRISVVKEYLVHWRVEQNQGSSTTCSGPKVMVMADQCKICYDLLVKYGLDEYAKEEFWAHVADANFGLFNNIKWEYKAIYFDKIYELFSLSKKYNLQFKYFSKYTTKFYHFVLNHDFFNASKIIHNVSLSNFRRCLISVRWPTKHFPHWRVIVLGIQIGSQIDYNIPTLFRIHI